ncbi:MAG: hypothetical protein QXG39_08585 [Candidatus Aenigmatarchaeota archaeon]
MKEEDFTTIAISRAIKNKLNLLKYELRMRNIAQVIAFLIDFYEKHKREGKEEKKKWWKW